MTRALTRLDGLRQGGILADAEHEVARNGMLGVTEGSGEGRSIRIEAYRALSPSAGSPVIVMDVLTKARLFKYDWTHLALRLDRDQLRDHLLGLRYESAPERWDNLLSKLESLSHARHQEHLSSDQFGSVKYGILGRLDWLELVGELVWLRHDVDGLNFWRREDGWGVSDEDVGEMTDWVARHTPYQESPVKHERIHHYFDWIDDQAWRFYNRMIAEGDFAFLRSHGIVRIDDGKWTY